MLVFPQLSTGAASVYPVRRTQQLRTVQNTMADGRVISFSDPDFREMQWDLDATGLTKIEFEAIQTLFGAVRGQEGTFTFLEPAGNLLAQSEAFGADAWDQSGTLGFTAGIADPWGTARATRITNSGPSTAWLGQALPVPGEFQYALSVWVRSTTATSVVLFAESTGGSVDLEMSVGSEWRRVPAPVVLGSKSESVRFGVRIGSGKSVDLVGMQVEAQPGAGAYQRTTQRSGVHGKARFAMDELTTTARGTDVFDCAMRIVSKGN